MPEVLAVEENNVMPIEVEKFLQEQAEDPLCKQAADIARKPGSQCDHDRYGLLVQKPALNDML